MSEIKFVSGQRLAYYDTKLKAWVEAKDAENLAVAKKYAEDLGVNYDPSGTAQTKADELANGPIAANAAAIAKLNGGADVEGSVAKAVADAKAVIDADVDAVEAKADAAQAAADKAQGEVDAVEAGMGDVDGLSTTNKTIVGAINEVLTAVGTGGTAAAVTITTDTTTDGALKSYTIKQGNTTVGVIDIPKDMVVESGSVVVDPEGQPAGTYIKLILANVAEPLYINVGTLVDLYTAEQNAAQVQLTIDPATRVISAAIVAGSVDSVALADNAVITAKIADANVTKAKLSSAVQASLDKADAAAPQTALDAEIARAQAAEGKALADAKVYADGIVATEKTRAEEAENALDARLDAVEAQLGTGEGSVDEKISAAQDAAEKHADDLNTAMDGRMAAVEAAKHTHSNKNLLDTYTQTEANLAAAVTMKHEHANADVINSITAAKVTAWNSAEQNAKDYADGKDAAIAEAKKAGNDAADAVSTLEAGKVTDNATAISGHEDRIAALEAVEHTEITEDEIDAWFV